MNYRSYNNGTPNVHAERDEMFHHLEAARMIHRSGQIAFWTACASGGLGALIAIAKLDLQFLVTVACVFAPIATGIYWWNEWNDNKAFLTPKHVFCRGCRRHLPSTQGWVCFYCRSVNKGDNNRSFLVACHVCKTLPASIECPYCSCRMNVRLDADSKEGTDEVALLMPQHSDFSGANGRDAQ